MSNIISRFALVLAMSAGASASEPAAHQVNGPPRLRPGVASKITPARLSRPLLTMARPEHGALLLTLDPLALSELKSSKIPVLIETVPLGVDHTVSLEVERFRVTLPTTQFMIGQADGGSVPFVFDPDSIVLLRGRIAGDLNSHVFLALSEHASNGVIESSLGRFGLSSHSPTGAQLGANEIAVFHALNSGHNPTPLCHLDDERPANDIALGGKLINGLRQVELAIETDYEFFQIFGDKAATLAYIVELYGAASDIFMRDINTRLDLTFVRIWDTPTEPFEASLQSFVTYWDENMQSVHRDAAQMFSGRGDLPGGVAVLAAMCGPVAYSFCGNPVGHFAGVEASSVYNHDLLVCAHELGHNFGTHHTDFYGLDICNQSNTPPQRGTLMSYCSQTVSGGASVTDMAFHKVTQDAMKSHLYEAECVVFDCNQNGISDSLDVANSTSLDANANEIPDECEDCNGNGILDTLDIFPGSSADLNGNGLPDECEPDCNGNDIPDDLDIESGFSQDLHGNTIPDECEADCDSNSVSDYNQIMGDMTLDRNRNVMLDACEDCDDDGQTDLNELDGAWNTWAASNAQNVIRQYHAVTGVLMDTSDAGHVNQPSDLIVAPGRRVLVSSFAAHKIVEFDHQGNFVHDLVSAGAGGLSSPSGMLVSPAGTLLVVSSANQRVLQYDLTTGAFMSTFVQPGAGGLTQPRALTYGPDGHLYVTSGINQVLKYDGATGAFLAVFISSGASGGLNSPRGMTFKPDGNLLVTSFGNNSVLEYNGLTGAFLKSWAVVGVAFQGPWCIRIAPNGHVHVSTNLVTESHLTKARIHEFNINTGNWVRGYVMGADSAIIRATGFDYLPGDATDCNKNQLPDNCDIAGGFSSDLNSNGIPDECEALPCTADITGDATVDLNDLLAVINTWGDCSPPCPPTCAADIAADCTVDVDDLLAVITTWGPCL